MSKIKVVNRTYFLIQFLFFCAITGQSQIYFGDIARHKINQDSIQKIFKKNEGLLLNRIKKESPLVNSEIKKMYDRKIKLFNDLIEKNEFVTNDSISDILNRIIGKISKNLAFQPNQFILFLDPTLIPNAASWGNGIIVINMGLLTKYKTEDELAFIICHEIAHDILDHNLKRERREKKMGEEEGFKKKYRKATRTRYGRFNTVKSVTEKWLLKTTIFTRQDELEADSLGFVLLEKTGYQGSYSLSSLKLLEKADEQFFEEKLDLKEVFHSENYPFQPQWLSAEMSGEEKKHVLEINDSLKTHPDCQIRINKILQNFKVDTVKKNSLNTINSLNDMAYFENLDYCHSSGNILLSLYFAIQLQQKNPGNEYITMVICHSLYQLGTALKLHKFSNYVPFPNPDFESDLNTLVVFLTNLNYRDYKELTNEFYRIHTNSQANSKYLKHAKIYAESFGLTEEEVMTKIKLIN